MMYNLRIRDLREDNDLYQRHLAEYLNVTQQTYSRYESGELRLSINDLIKLAQFYNTSIEYILGLTSNKSNFKGYPIQRSENH